MTSATQRALVTRAIRAAELMEDWREEIAKEMDRQGAWYSLINDPDETVTLKARLASAMVSHMTQLIGEIRGFQRNLVTQRLGRPSN
jgi:hypothetical protein